MPDAKKPVACGRLLGDSVEGNLEHNTHDRSTPAVRLSGSVSV
jgi:hypothetical protein